MSLSQQDIWRLKHILEAINNVEECVAKKDVGDKFFNAALERFIINIGEMCRGASKTMQSQYPDIPWANIISMRNVLVHEYYKVNQETIWDIAEHKIPALKDWINGILEKN